MTTHLDMERILSRAPVIPVLTIERVDRAVPLARALAAGGLNVIEITLRTDAALKAIERVRAEIPDIVTGAGTITHAEEIEKAKLAGAQFAVSPGTTRAVLDAASGTEIPFLPGVATASDVMQVREAGFTHAKFFPAEPAGGTAMLTAFAGPFPEMRFCPTGGIGPANFRSYLGLANVCCVGGSWIAPADAVNGSDWRRITALAQETAPGAGRSSESAKLRS